MLKINLEYSKGILFVRLKGNLNANTTIRFKEYTFPIIKDYKVKYMIYNLSELVSIDSTGESALLEGIKCVNSNKGKVLLVNNSINTNLKLHKASNSLLALDLLTV